jgi:hypothetical protein
MIFKGVVISLITGANVKVKFSRRVKVEFKFPEPNAYDMLSRFEISMSGKRRVFALIFRKLVLVLLLR